MENSIVKVLLFLIFVLLSGCGGKTKEELLFEGNKLKSEGNYSGAIVFYKNALEKDSDYLEARYALGENYMATGHFDLSEKEFQKVLLQNQNFRDASLELAKTYLALNRPEDAIESAKKHLSVKPDDSQGLAVLGAAELMTDKFSDAEQHFKRSIELDPKNQKAKIGLSNLYVKTGFPAKARNILETVIRDDRRNSAAYHLLASLERSSGNRQAALKTYETLIQEVPEDIEGPYMAGLLYFFSGDSGKTKAMADHVLGRYPGNPLGELLTGLSSYLEGDFRQALVSFQLSAAKQRRLATEYFTGMAHFKLGEYEQAITMFQRCLDITPGAAEPRLMLAMNLLKQNRPQDSAAEAKKIIDADPVNALAYNILGSSLIKLGNFEEGMDALDRATGLDPGLADAHFKKGILSLYGKGDEKVAEKELSLALELSPEVLSTRLVMASMYAKKKDYLSAEKTLREGLRGTPDDAVLYHLLAQIYSSEKKTGEAVESLKKAQRANPSFFNSYYTLASYYSSRGQHDLALREFESVLAIDPANSRALSGAGQVAGILGDKNKAEGFFERAAKTGAKGAHRPHVSSLIENGDDKKAIATLEEVVKANPEDTLALEDLGNLYLEKGNFEKALETFGQLMKTDYERGAFLSVNTLLRTGQREQALAVAEDAIQRRENAAIGYMLKAMVVQKSGDAKKAEEILMAGAGAVKDNRKVLIALATLYESNKNEKAAKSVYEGILKRSPDYVPAIYSLAAMAQRRGENVEAERFYGKVLEVAPWHVPSLNNLACLYSDYFNDLDKALALSSKAFSKDPSNPAVIETVGYVLFKRGKYEKAKPILEKARKLMPSDPTTSYHLALCYKETGEPALAVGLLRDALSKGGFSERDKAEQLLSQLTR